MKRRLPTITEQPAGSVAEHYRAQWWRMHIMGLTVQQLADLTGYTIEAIYLFERGVSSSGKKVKPWAWQRFKNACAGVTVQGFDWK